MLFGCITAVCVWISYKKRPAFITALCFLIIFFIIRDADLIYHKQQQKLIVYNVPQHPAVDFIAGNTCCFAGDTSVLTDALLRNFNLNPARIRNRIYGNNNIILPTIDNIIVSWGGKTVLVLNSSVHDAAITEKIAVDIIILSGNAKISIAELQRIFDCNQFVSDSSNPSWKSWQWEKDCEHIHLRFHSVTRDGAFTLKI
jgi:competence protein ComEC